MPFLLNFGEAKANWSCRNAANNRIGRNVPSDYGTSGNHCAATYTDTFEYGNASSYPNIIFDDAVLWFRPS